MVLGTQHVRAAREWRDHGQRAAGEGGRRPHLRHGARIRLSHLWSDGVRGSFLLGLQQRRSAGRRDEDASNEAGLRRAPGWLRCGAERGRSGNMSRIGRTLATCVVALSGWSCGSTAPDATPQVAAIVVSPATSTLALNAQLPLQAEVKDGAGTVVPGASVTWTVKDPKIVSVSAAVVVTGLAIGSTQVAANALGKSGIATITVTKTPVANVVLLPNRIDATVGSTTQLTATAYDGSGNALTDRAIIWSSSNQAVATVSTGGLVIAVAPGTSTITAASEGKTSTSIITVAQGAVAKVVVSPNPVTMMAGQSAQLALSARDAS